MSVLTLEGRKPYKVVGVGVGEGVGVGVGEGLGPVGIGLGQVGEGGHIALNVLYAGRWKLGFSSAAGCKTGIKIAYDFSLDRKQFNKPIGSFQLIQKKLAEMLTEITKAQLLSWKLGKLMNKG